jgi:signal transduction histidine kinase
MVLNFSDISLLKASERKRSELLNFLSHDLRSPLVSVLALVKLAEAKDPPHALQDLLARMRDHTENTIEMAEQFLQLARAESSQDYPLQELDLAAVVLNAVEQVWAQARARDISLENRQSTEEAWVMGDGSLLERALVNLLNNAIKYSPPGRTVRITLEQQQDVYRCCVIDNGYGISARALPHLFDRFQRVERPPDQRAGGIGLGLAFVDTVIRRTMSGVMLVWHSTGRHSIRPAVTGFCRLTVVSPPIPLPVLRCCRVPAFLQPWSWPSPAGFPTRLLQAREPLRPVQHRLSELHRL